MAKMPAAAKRFFPTRFLLLKRRNKDAIITADQVLPPC
jgi:hypothetical protein